MGKIGNDAFGELVYSQLKEYDAHHGMIISDDVNTSYSVVLAPKGFDRIFLHHSGANDLFYKKDLDFSQIEDATLFHFGYLPLMKSMYENDGAEVVEMFSDIKKLGVFTSMDMAAVDEDSPSGKECLQLATATGASCVAAYDALSGLKSFEELKEKIQNGWEKNL